jgi:hypothetical protein
MGCLNREGCGLTLKTDCQRTNITNETRENYVCPLWLQAEKVSFVKIDPQKIHFCKGRFSAFLNLATLFIKIIFFHKIFDTIPSNRAKSFTI